MVMWVGLMVIFQNQRSVLEQRGPSSRKKTIQHATYKWKVIKARKAFPTGIGFLFATASHFLNRQVYQGQVALIFNSNTQNLLSKLILDDIFLLAEDLNVGWTSLVFLPLVCSVRLYFHSSRRESGEDRSCENRNLAPHSVMTPTYVFYDPCTGEEIDTPWHAKSFGC